MLKHDYQKKVNLLVEKIMKKTDLPNVNNFYTESNYKKQNLINYLYAMYEMKPTYLMIGEAPGVKGCYLTGIPFTSERIIKQGRLNRHFKNLQIEVRGDSYEGTAFYMWEAIDQMEKPPLLWNVFPLHPFKIEKGKVTNRTPNQEEKKWGKEIFSLITDIFPNIKVITVGNHAKDLCDKLNIETSGHLIHPAYHPHKFREQFSKLLPYLNRSLIKEESNVL